MANFSILIVDTNKFQTLNPTILFPHWFCSMKQILEKHSTHSKNLEKQDKLISLDLNVSKLLSRDLKNQNF